MRAGQGVATMLATSAGLRLGSVTEQPLPQPEREPLLADSAWALEQERAGKGAAPDRVVETAADRVVAVKWEKRHEPKLRRLDRIRRVVDVVPGRHGI